MKLAMVHAYKFLAAGACAPFKGSRWPAPRVWVRACDAAADLPSGIRVCRPGDLPYWLDDELWEVAVNGDVVTQRYALVAPRVMLLQPVAAWTPATMRELAAACAWRARDEVVSRLGDAGLTTLARALAAPDSLAAFAERATQLAVDAPSAWTDTLGLVGECGAEAEHARPATAILTATVTVAGWDEAAQAGERAWQAGWICRRLGLPVAPT